MAGFYLNIPFTFPFTYSTFYYSGVGPYHEYDNNNNQDALPLYPHLTESMHFEEYGFATTAGLTGQVQMYFGGSAASPTTTSYYFLSFNAEIDFFQIVPYKQIFFFTRPWDIMEPAGGPPMGDNEGPMIPAGSDEGDSFDDGDEGDDSWDDEDDGSWDEETVKHKLSQDGDSWDDSWEDGSDDVSWDDTTSWDDSLGSWDDSWASGEDDSAGSLEGEGEAQGFHMYVGAAYDLEFVNAYMQYCEGTYTGTASIWTIGTSYWTAQYASGGSSNMRTDCWQDPELFFSVDMLIPPKIPHMFGQV